MKTLKVNYYNNKPSSKLYVILKLVSPESSKEIFGYHLISAYVHSIENIQDPKNHIYHICHTSTEYLHFFPGCKGREVDVITENINTQKDWDIASDQYYKLLYDRYDKYWKSLNDINNTICDKSIVHDKALLTLCNARDEYRAIAYSLKCEVLPDHGMISRDTFCKLQNNDHEYYLETFVNKWVLEE